MTNSPGHPEICTNTELIFGQKYSAEYTLTDDRTYPSGVNKTYKVRKFADSTTDAKSGRCWMTENLRINNTTLKSASSDFSGNDIVLPNSAKSDFKYDDTSRYSYQSYLSTVYEASAGVSAYYNWYTATAGTGTSSIITNGQNLDTSICPKGWKLPSGGTDTTTSEFGKFTVANSIGNNSAGSRLIQNDIYNFKYTGGVNDGSLGNGTGGGAWWSSTAYNAYDAYDLSIGSSAVAPGTGTPSRYVGFAVRCIARDS